MRPRNRTIFSSPSLSAMVHVRFRSDRDFFFRPRHDDSFTSSSFPSNMHAGSSVLPNVTTSTCAWTPHGNRVALACFSERASFLPLLANLRLGVNYSVCVLMPTSVVVCVSAPVGERGVQTVTDSSARANQFNTSRASTPQTTCLL